MKTNLKIALLVTVVMAMGSEAFGQVRFNTTSGFALGDSYRSAIVTDTGYITIGIRDDSVFFSNTISFVWHNLNGAVVKRKQLKREGSSYYAMWHNTNFLYKDGFVTFTGYDDSLTTNPPNTGDILLARYDANGDTLWTKRYNSGFFDTGYSSLETENLCILGVGTSDLNGDGVPKISRAIKYDSIGNIIWNKTYYSGAASAITSAINSDDGSYYLGGQYRQWSNTYSKTMILKIDQQGEIIWPKFLPNVCDEYTASLCLSSDGNILVGGTECIDQPNVNASPHQELYLGKLNKVDGSIMWDTSYNTDIAGFNGLLFVQELSNGDIIGGGMGYQLDDEGNYDDLGVLIKTNSLGELLWKRYYTFNEDSVLSCYISSCKHTPDGGFILAGRAFGVGFDEGWLLKTDENGCIDLSCVNGIEELEEDDFRLFLYPNPAAEYVSIDLPITHTKGTMQIYNLQGQLIKSEGITGGGLQSLDIADIPNGIYNLVVYSAANKLLGREKLVVVR
jgi:hypothetical protein